MAHRWPSLRAMSHATNGFDSGTALMRASLRPAGAAGHSRRSQLSDTVAVGMAPAQARRSRWAGPRKLPRRSLPRRGNCVAIGGYALAGARLGVSRDRVGASGVFLRVRGPDRARVAGLFVPSALETAGA